MSLENRLLVLFGIVWSFIKAMDKSIRPVCLTVESQSK